MINENNRCQFDRSYRQLSHLENFPPRFFRFKITTKDRDICVAEKFIHLNVNAKV